MIQTSVSSLPVLHSSRRSIMGRALLTAVFSTLLVACGNGETPGADTGAASAKKSEDARSATSEARKHPETGDLLADRQRLVVGNGSEPASLDPQVVEGTIGGNIVDDLFEGLTSSGPKGELVPAVAESWSASEDRQTWTFKLRTDAKWSDGSPVTAADFVFGWQRAVDPALGSTYAYYMEIAGIINATEIMQGAKAPSELGVRALDEHTLEVKLNAPIAYLADMTSHYTMYPAPRKVIEKHGKEWTKPGNLVSNGAFVLESWDVGEKLVARRNTNYWDNANNLIDEVVFLPIESTSAELQRFEAGEIHYTSTVPSTQIDRLRKERPDELVISPYIGVYMYQFNVERKPFDDVRIREALTLAIDRDIIVKHITKSGQIPAYSFVPGYVNGFEFKQPDHGTWTQERRDERAQQLFEEAGYSKDKPLEFELLYNTNEDHKQIAVAVSQMWKQKLGAQVTPTNMEWKTYLSEKTAGNFTVTRYGWIGDYNEASTFLSLLTSTSGQNDGNWKNRTYDQLLEDARFSANPNEQYAKAENILAEEFPVAPIYFYTNVAMVSKNLVGYPVDNPQNKKYSKSMYIKAN